MIKRIAMWSGPRNLSTAIMRSFSSRNDCWVTDEPYYAAFLAKSGVHHPMLKESLLSGSHDPGRVALDCLQSQRTGKSLHYQKHMIHHMLPDFDLGWTAKVTNAFLIRDPARVLASYVKKRERPEEADLGFDRQLALFEQLSKVHGRKPLVIDSKSILLNPQMALENLCKALGIDWDPSMLSWHKGPHPDDGVWGQHWYDGIWSSTGFQPFSEPDLPEFSRAEQAMIDRARDLQAPLQALAL